MNTQTAPVCPRCEGFIPRNSKPGAYSGALSRADNKTEVCSPCGEEEALVALFPTEAWPIGRLNDPLQQAAVGRFIEATEMILHGDCLPKDKP